MKKMLLLALFMLSINTYAASQPKNEDDESHIVKPEVATSVYRARHITYSENLDTLVCLDKYKYDWRDDTCKDKDGKNQWRTIKQVTPANKTYVGFKSTSAGSSHVIDIYWK